MSAHLILVVEDNDEIRESIESILEVNGFAVQSAANVKDAIDVLDDSNQTPDLIISDIRMPGLNGYDFLDIIRQQERFQNVPFVFLTALGEDQHRELALEKGSDGYIVKPFQPEGLVATIRNRIKRMTQMKQFSESQLDRTRHVLLQVLSHELRTPLTYVMGGFALMREEVELHGKLDAEKSPDLVHHIFEVVDAGTRRLFRVAEQTSLLAELMSGHVARHWETISRATPLNAIMETVVNLAAITAREKSVTVNVESQTEDSVYGVEAMLVKGIFEVVHNAIHFSSANSVVDIQCYRDGKMVVIEVADQGRGIIEEDIDKIWQIMHQSQREKYEHQGLGLGLTLAKGIIEAHNGDISLESEEGVGTTVWIRLPAYTG